VNDTRDEVGTSGERSSAFVNVLCMRCGQLHDLPSWIQASNVNVRGKSVTDSLFSFPLLVASMVLLKSHEKRKGIASARQQCAIGMGMSRPFRTFPVGNNETWLVQGSRINHFHNAVLSRAGT
jgi:hypothetical protein